ncbi:hypothetical protein BOTBODRAFT_69923 [Botryobasidium botryosum FD-172 SS1]|uniref:Glucose-methanol-choline oxidoreductase C-terminal domain-containing protein n=1 Tax=Botryobasidium botryosum (strain FD-172 SS1) TaxID=930990 RepID=A0A067M967_BOTB1|nr:hypothetical protein BOTBODRAFT_69923 [Botryobasidium botryosum FD-172 SS1]
MSDDKHGFENKFFTLTAKEAAGSAYDIIIVGSGIGGGVLANDLYDTNAKLGKNAKSVLLIEKGGVVFHSHCLNTARPSGLENDRGQQNDTFFAQFKEDYTFYDTDVTDWKGGPMFNLGGRSPAWGLFAPRIHDQSLGDHLHPDVKCELLNDYYDKAERLMLLSLPETQTFHQHVMDRLNMDGLNGVQWQWGRIASEFRDPKNYDFAEGAYSSIDKILEIAMSKPKRNGQVVEHDYFKTVLNTEVRSLNFGSSTDHPVTGVNVRSSDGKELEIKVKSGGSVVLCGGSVASPSILLRSGDDDWKKKIRSDWGGLRLTDHDILFYAHSFRYQDPADRAKVGSMKLQTYANISSGNVALVNMSIDASSFLPRGESEADDIPKFIMVFILKCALQDDSNIRINSATGEPEVKIKRAPDATHAEQQVMKKLTAEAMKSIKSTLKVNFLGQNDDWEPTFDDITLSKLQLGGVAHELGTLPMRGKSDVPHCLNTDLQFEDVAGLYACDLSVFPYSPESNPSLTLAALAIRLSRHLNKRLHVEAPEEDTVYAVNHSGRKVKVWLSNKAEEGASDEIILEPGADTKWKREAGVLESLFVYKLDLSDPTGATYLREPVLLVAHPKRVTVIL